MLFKIAAPVAGTLLALAATVAPTQAAATTVLADWPMNEPAGDSVLHDVTGHGVTGKIGSAVSRVTIGDAKAFSWSKVNPNEAPAKPERLVTVDDDRLNPGSEDYTVEMKFRTTHSYGNMIQKGQSGSKGGYFKFQNVRGKITCMFRGVAADGTMVSKAVNTGTTPLNDGAWHTLRCERSADKVELWIDNATKPRRGRGPTGTISNKVPLTIAGKTNCDQVTVTCDYFSGEIDYVRIFKG